MNLDIQSRKKIIYKMSIEYPVISILLVIIMTTTLYVISINNNVNKYLEIKGDIIQGSINLACEPQYYLGIRKYNKAIWYRNSESEICTAIIENVSLKNDLCFITLKVNNKDLNDRSKIADVTIKICYGQESIFEHLIK